MTAACRWLKVDWDKGTKPPTVEQVQWLLRRAGFRLVTFMQKRSPSGRGWHGWFEVRPVPTFTQIVALQAMLGSDPAREACNLIRSVQAPTLPTRTRRRWNVTYTRSATMALPSLRKV